MAGLSEKFKSLIGGLFDGGFDPGDEIYDEMKNGMREDYEIEDNLALSPSYMTNPREKRDLKVLNSSSYAGGYEVLVCEPRSYEESVGIVKHLKARKTIVLNLHLLEKEQSQRIVDFLCGATNAIDGNQQKIGDCVFIFTPQNITLAADAQKTKFISDGLWNQTK